MSDEEENFKKEIRKYEFISRSISYFAMGIAVLAIATLLVAISIGIEKARSEVWKEMGWIK